MKKLLDALYLTLGTVCLFGLPAAILGFSAWFGDGAVAMLHTSASALQHLSTQAEVILVVFGTSAGGLAAAMATFTAVWYGAQAINRAAQGIQPMAATPSGGATRRADDGPEVGRMQHGGTQRRARQQHAA